MKMMGPQVGRKGRCYNDLFGFQVDALILTCYLKSNVGGHPLWQVRITNFGKYEPN
jgi:hypothetical protein